jgi:hypothetical protein
MARVPRGAEDRLRRLLVMLPWLMERGEVPLAEVAERFGLTESQVAADLELVAMCGLPPIVDELIDIFIDEGTVFVKLTPKKDRSRSQATVVADVRRGAAQLAGVTASISTGFNEGQKQIQLQLQGEDSAVLARLADQIVAEVKQVPGAVDVGLSTKGQKPELDVQVDRGLAGSLGVTVGQVAQALRDTSLSMALHPFVSVPSFTEERALQSIHDASGQLPPLLRVPFVMFEVQGLSGKSIAAILRCPESTVWRRLHVARRAVTEVFLGDRPGP